MTLLLGPALQGSGREDPARPQPVEWRAGRLLTELHPKATQAAPGQSQPDPLLLARAWAQTELASDPPSVWARVSVPLGLSFFISNM